ncbi:AraC family transcriptional regulator ligand-binding domain-containing protein [Nocardioides daeguensis]|uniref:AraC family transcriptional regulator n=1 Tax=Nocardioides daeguensis TaxID=908359 RepID=A0ABP6W0S3_9ACTN|nr:AraC family transcriptional regulator ligand-binding domain-containing protein [Nocardioides daeguensis]MBV6726641.1 AraC family transcriptional regulator ligand-binding domain-containing protein [Nocardioides daeguensis]MCR1774607.1 AraC family transcriptional regulator ligand-binding domain-containing protein [Nocardioides daeguensis]
MMPSSFEPPAARDWQFPRHVAGTALLVAMGAEAGVSTAALLRGTGLGARDVADPQREVTAEQELRVVRNLLATAPGVTGAHVGAAYHASTFGPLGFALLSSPTLGDAANLALRFIDLSFTFTIPSATVEDQDVVVRVDDRGVPADVRRFLVERDLTAIWTVLREICGSSAGLDAAWDADRSTLRFATRWLDHPLPQANAHACAIAEALCRDLVSPRRGRNAFTGQVRILVAQHLEAGAPMGTVAAALGLSERSLRRRLTEVGTTYRAVLDDVRSTAAEQLLADGLLLDDVARRLGYAEASSFVVAHRRWTGRTPRETRDPATGGGS